MRKFGCRSSWWSDDGCQMWLLLFFDAAAWVSVGGQLNQTDNHRPDKKKIKNNNSPNQSWTITRPKPSWITKNTASPPPQTPAYFQGQNGPWCLPQKNKQKNNYFSSPTWLSSVSAAILKLGSMVPLRAWIIRLGSMCVQFQCSFCVLVSHIYAVSLRFCFTSSQALWLCIHCGPTRVKLPRVTNTTSGQYVLKKQLISRGLITEAFWAAAGRSFWRKSCFSFFQTVASLTENGGPAPFYRQPTVGGRKAK